MSVSGLFVFHTAPFVAANKLRIDPIKPGRMWRTKPPAAESAACPGFLAGLGRFSSVGKGPYSLYTQEPDAEKSCLERLSKAGVAAGWVTAPPTIIGQ